jgi:hypothetical protein
MCQVPHGSKLGGLTGVGVDQLDPLANARVQEEGLPDFNDFQSIGPGEPFRERRSGPHDEPLLQALFRKGSNQDLGLPTGSPEALVEIQVTDRHDALRKREFSMDE